MFWQEKSSVCVCELCHDNGKSVSVPLIENDKLQVSSPLEFDCGPATNNMTCSSQFPGKNGKVCKSHHFFSNFDLISTIKCCLFCIFCLQTEKVILSIL